MIIITRSVIIRMYTNTLYDIHRHSSVIVTCLNDQQCEFCTAEAAFLCPTNITHRTYVGSIKKLSSTFKFISVKALLIRCFVVTFLLDFLLTGCSTVTAGS